MILTGSIIVLFLNSIEGLSVTLFPNIDIFRYLTFQIYLQIIPVSYATVV